MNQRFFREEFLRIEFIAIFFILIFFFIDYSWAAVKQPRLKEKQVSTREDSTIGDSGIHIARKGETLYRIAKMNGLSVNELKDLNGLRDNRLRIGQRLVLREEKAEMPLEEMYPFHSEAPEDSAVEESEEGTIGRALSYARDLLGIPYHFGGTTLKAIDCSALVQKVFKSIGIVLPRTAREQFKAGREVEREDISKGDLVFFKTYSRHYPSHVGIYIGDNYFIHASTKKRKVRIDSLDEPYYRKRFIGAKRLVESEIVTEPFDNNRSS